jgi:hypothetical protein
MDPGIVRIVEQYHPAGFLQQLEETLKEKVSLGEPAFVMEDGRKQINVPVVVGADQRLYGEYRIEFDRSDKVHLIRYSGQHPWSHADKNETWLGVMAHTGYSEIPADGLPGFFRIDRWDRSAEKKKFIFPGIK